MSCKVSYIDNLEVFSVNLFCFIFIILMIDRLGWVTCHLQCIDPSLSIDGASGAHEWWISSASGTTVKKISTFLVHQMWPMSHFFSKCKSHWQNMGLYFERSIKTPVHFSLHVKWTLDGEISYIWITGPQSTNPKYFNDTNNARY
jgi:hypothetical protein